MTLTLQQAAWRLLLTNAMARVMVLRLSRPGLAHSPLFALWNQLERAWPRGLSARAWGLFLVVPIDKEAWPALAQVEPRPRV